MKSKKRFTYIIIVLFFALFVAAATFAANLSFAAEAAPADAIVGDDGVYSCEYEVGGTSLTGQSMILENCEPTVTVEKITQNGESLYYVSFVIKSGQSMSDITMTLDSKRLGLTLVQERTEGGNKVQTYMIALSDSNVRRAVGVSAYVAAMNRSVTFTIAVTLSSATYVGSAPAYDGERPAQFVPTISANLGGDVLVKQGTEYVLPAVSADFGEVSVKVFYGDGNEDVTVTDGKFTLSKAGYYTVIYTAVSYDYTTSAGNPATGALSFTVQVSSDGAAQQNAVWEDTLGKIEDVSSAVAGYAVLAATRYTSGEAYESARSALGNAEKFIVVSMTLTDGDGAAIALGGDVKVSLNVPTTYDRSNTSVYLLENGSLSSIDGSFSGSKYVFETDKLGVFVIAENNASRSGCGSVGSSLIALAAALATVCAALIVKKGKKT